MPFKFTETSDGVQIGDGAVFDAPFQHHQLSNKIKIIGGLPDEITRLLEKLSEISESSWNKLIGNQQKFNHTVQLLGQRVQINASVDVKIEDTAIEIHLTSRDNLNLSEIIGIFGEQRPEPNFEFTGRIKEFKCLNEELHQSKKAVIVPDERSITDGMIGVGKTQLAAEYAYQSHEMYRKTSKEGYPVVIWFSVYDTFRGNELIETIHKKHTVDSLKQSLTLYEQYIEIGKKLGVVIESDASKNNNIQKIKVQIEKLPKVLVIFDDVNNYKSIQEYVPESVQKHACHCLFTSRYLTWQKVRKAKKIEMISVPYFNQKESEDYIIQSFTQDMIFSKKSNKEQTALARALAVALFNYPRALAHAITYIHEVKTNIKTYLEYVEKNKSVVPSHLANVNKIMIAALLAMHYKKKDEENKHVDLLLTSAYLYVDTESDELFATLQFDEQNSLMAYLQNILRKTPNLGTSNFEDVRQPEITYVDKTLLIKDIIEGNSKEAKNKVKVFTRPTRFGKSLNLSMLEYYLDYRKKPENETKNLFNGLIIQKSGFNNKHQNRYMVIALDFLTLGTNTFTEFKIKLKRYFAELYDKYIFVYDNLKEGSRAKNYFQQILKYDESLENDISDVALGEVLKNLLQYCREYNNKTQKDFIDSKPIVLIDEYDSPLVSAKIHGFWEEAVSFLRTIILSAFKGNDENYFQAVITGVTRLAGEKMFSPQTNNAVIYSLTKKRYSEYFGLTEEELRKVLNHSQYRDSIDEKIRELEKHYGHYYFGKLRIFNPWSVFHALFKDGRKIRYERYWLPNEQGKFDLCSYVLKTMPKEIKIEIEPELLTLVRNQFITLPITESVSMHSETELDPRTWFYSLLYLSGFITKLPTQSVKSQIQNYPMMIPNYECQLYFVQDLLPILSIRLTEEAVLSNFRDRDLLIRDHSDSLFSQSFVEESTKNVDQTYHHLLCVCALLNPNQILLELLTEFAKSERKEDEISRFISLLRDQQWASYHVGDKFFTFNSSKIHNHLLKKLKSSKAKNILDLPLYLTLTRDVYHVLVVRFTFTLFDEVTYKSSQHVAHHLYSVIVHLYQQKNLPDDFANTLVKLMNYYLYYELNVDNANDIYQMFTTWYQACKHPTEQEGIQQAVMYSLYGKLQCKLNQLNKDNSEHWFFQAEELFKKYHSRNAERLLNHIRWAKYYRQMFQYAKSYAQYEQALAYCASETAEYHYVTIEKIFIQFQLDEKNIQKLSLPQASERCEMHLLKLKKLNEKKALLAKAYVKIATLKMILRKDDPQIKQYFKAALRIIQSLESPDHIEYAKVQCAFYAVLSETLSKDDFAKQMTEIKLIFNKYYRSSLSQYPEINIIYFRFYWTQAEYYFRTALHLPEAKQFYIKAKQLLEHIQRTIQSKSGELRYIRNLMRGINNNIGEIERCMGEMQAADNQYQLCLENSIVPTMASEVTRHDILPLNNLAELAINRGEFAEAKQKMNLIYDLIVEYYGEDHINTHIVNMNQLIQRCYQGNIIELYSGVDEHLHVLETAYQNGHDRKELANIACQLSEICLFIGNVDYAKSLIDYALKFYKNLGSKDDKQMDKDPVYRRYQMINAYLAVISGKPDLMLTLSKKAYQTFKDYQWISYPDYYHMLYYVCMAKYLQLNFGNGQSSSDKMKELYQRPIAELLQELKIYFESKQPYFKFRYADVCLLDAKINYLLGNQIQAFASLNIAKEIYVTIYDRHFKLSEIYYLEAKLCYKDNPGDQAFKEVYKRYRQAQNFPNHGILLKLSRKLAKENLLKPMSIHEFKILVQRVKKVKKPIVKINVYEKEIIEILINKNQEQLDEPQNPTLALINCSTQLITLRYLSGDYDGVLMLLEKYIDYLERYQIENKIQIDIQENKTLFLNLIYSVGFIPTQNGKFAEFMQPHVETLSENSAIFKEIKQLCLHNLACWYNLQSEEDRLEGSDSWKEWYLKAETIFETQLDNNQRALAEYVHMLYQKKERLKLLKTFFSQNQRIRTEYWSQILVYDLTEYPLLSSVLRRVFDFHGKLYVNSSVLLYFLVFMTCYETHEENCPASVMEIIPLLDGAVNNEITKNKLPKEFYYLGHYLLGYAYNLINNDKQAKFYFEESERLYDQSIEQKDTRKQKKFSTLLRTVSSDYNRPHLKSEHKKSKKNRPIIPVFFDELTLGSESKIEKRESFVFNADMFKQIFLLWAEKIFLFNIHTNLRIETTRKSGLLQIDIVTFDKINFNRKTDALLEIQHMIEKTFASVALNNLPNFKLHINQLNIIHSNILILNTIEELLQNEKFQLSRESQSTELQKLLNPEIYYAKFGEDNATKVGFFKHNAHANIIFSDAKLIEISTVLGWNTRIILYFQDYCNAHSRNLETVDLSVELEAFIRFDISDTTFSFQGNLYSTLFEPLLSRLTEKLSDLDKITPNDSDLFQKFFKLIVFKSGFIHEIYFAKVQGSVHIFQEIGLLTYYPEKNSYWLSPILYVLIKLYIKKQDININNILEKVISEFNERFNPLFSNQHFDYALLYPTKSFHQLEYYAAHLDSLVQFTQLPTQLQETYHLLLLRAAYALHVNGAIELSKQLLDRAIYYLNQLSPGEHTLKKGYYYLMLGKSYIASDNFDDAEKAFQGILPKGYLAKFKGTFNRTKKRATLNAIALSRLGYIKINQDSKEASKKLKLSLQIHEQLKKNGSQEYFAVEHAIALFYLGDYYYELGGMQPSSQQEKTLKNSYEQAIVLYEQAITCLKDFYSNREGHYRNDPETHIYIAEVYFRVSRCQRVLGQFEESKALLSHAIHSFEAFYENESHSKILRCQIELAKNVIDNNNPVEGLRILKSIEPYVKTGSQNGIDFHLAFGKAQHELGLHSEAHHHYRLALEGLISSAENGKSNYYADNHFLPSEMKQLKTTMQLDIPYQRIVHSLSARIMHYLGLNAYKMGDYYVAIQLFHEALFINLLRINSDFERNGRDELFYKDAFKVLNQQNNPKMLLSLHELGNCYYRQGKFSLAVDLFKQVLTIQQTAYGKAAERLKEVRATNNCLARVYIKLRQLDDAKILVDNSEHVATPTFEEVCRYDIASQLWLTQGNLLETANRLQKGLVLAETIEKDKYLEKPHPIKLRLYRTAAELLLFLGHYQLSERLLQNMLLLYHAHYSNRTLEIARAYHSFAEFYLHQSNYHRLVDYLSMSNKLYQDTYRLQGKEFGSRSNYPDLIHWHYLRTCQTYLEATHLRYTRRPNLAIMKFEEAQEFFSKLLNKAQRLLNDIVLPIHFLLTGTNLHLYQLTGQAEYKEKFTQHFNVLVDTISKFITKEQYIDRLDWLKLATHSYLQIPFGLENNVSSTEYMQQWLNILNQLFPLLMKQTSLPEEFLRTFMSDAFEKPISNAPICLAVLLQRAKLTLILSQQSGANRLLDEAVSLIALSQQEPDYVWLNRYVELLQIENTYKQLTLEQSRIRSKLDLFKNTIESHAQTLQKNFDVEDYDLDYLRAEFRRVESLIYPDKLFQNAEIKQFPNPTLRGSLELSAPILDSIFRQHQVIDMVNKLKQHHLGFILGRRATGKTQLAMEIGHHFKNENIRVCLLSTINVEQFYIQLKKLLQLISPENNGISLNEDELLKRTQNALTSYQPSLIILDGFSDNYQLLNILNLFLTDNLKEKHYFLINCFAGKHEKQRILTQLHDAWNLTLSDMECDLNRLNTESGWQTACFTFIKNNLTEKITEKTLNKAVKQMRGNPLSIHLFIALCNRRKYKIMEYIQQELFPILRSKDEAAVFNGFVENMLKVLTLEARELLLHLVYFKSDNLTKQLIRIVYESNWIQDINKLIEDERVDWPDELKALFNELQQCYLIMHDATQEKYSIHPVIQRAVIENLASQQKNPYHAHALDIIKRMLSETFHQGKGFFPDKEHYIEHAINAYETNVIDNLKWHRINLGLLITDYYLYYQRDFIKCRIYLDDIKKELPELLLISDTSQLDKISSEQKLRCARYLNLKAYLLLLQYRYKEAEEHIKDAKQCINPNILNELNIDFQNKTYINNEYCREYHMSEFIEGIIISEYYHSFNQSCDKFKTLLTFFEGEDLETEMIVRHEYAKVIIEKIQICNNEIANTKAKWEQLDKSTDSDDYRHNQKKHARSIEQQEQLVSEAKQQLDNAKRCHNTLYANEQAIKIYHPRYFKLILAELKLNVLNCHEIQLHRTTKPTNIETLSYTALPLLILHENRNVTDYYIRYKDEKNEIHKKNWNRH